jgi:hypothetical protein
MHDFENVVNNYQYDQPRVRKASAPLPAQAAPTPARKQAPAAADAAAHAKSKPSRRLTMEQPAFRQPSDGRDSSNAAHAGSGAAAEREPPPSTARHPAAAAAPPPPAPRKSGAESTASKPAAPAEATPAAALRRNPGCPLPPTRPAFTPASAALRHSGTPSSTFPSTTRSETSTGAQEPASPRRSACPRVTPARQPTSFLPLPPCPRSSRPSGAPSQHGAALADAHFNPTPLSVPVPSPATVVGGTAPAKNTAGGAGFRSPPPRPAPAPSKKRSGSGEPGDAVGPATSTARKSTASPAAGPPAATAPPAAATKGARTTVTRPAQHPRALPFLGAAAPSAPAPAPAPAPGPPINLARFGSGPGIKRPADCPPLFKPCRGRRPAGAGAATTPARPPRPQPADENRPGSHKRQRGEFGAFSPAWQASLAPAPASEWKQAQAAAAGAQLLGRERSLLGVLGRAAAPPPLPVLAPPPAAAPQQLAQPLPLGSSLAWACAQLQRSQQ